MQRDVYLSSRRSRPNTSLTTGEKVVGVLGLIALLAIALLAGGSFLFNVALPLLGRMWQDMTSDGKLALVEGCVAYGLIGPFLIYGWAGAKSLRAALAIAIIAIVIMPFFVLGYSAMSDLWRSIFRTVLGW